MPKNIPQLVEQLTLLQEAKEATLYAGASYKQICDFEERLNISLPDDLKTLYSYSNGFQIHEDFFEMFSLHEIKPNSQEILHENDVAFYFSDYLLFSDAWSISVSSTNNSYTIFQKDIYQTIYTDSIVQFLEVVISKGVLNGLWPWKEEINRRK